MQSNPMSTARTNVLSAVSSELGISQTQLQSQLQSGKSLAQIASAAGVSSDQLNSTITTALQQSNLPAGTDIASLATKMANHVPGHHHHHGGAPSATAATTDSTSSTSSSASTAADESALSTLLNAGSSVNTYL
jgi:hypothetical protein